jgi:lipopolysaccharide biosynthesis glycosyltransferase
MPGAPLNVALTFDDNYWAPAYAVMRSICLSSNQPGDLVFHLFHIGLSVEHRAALTPIADEFGATLLHTDLAANTAYRVFVADLPIARPFSPVIYARLLLDQLLPPEITRLAYLDCDTLVRAPIETLLATDLGGKAIAAVLDAHRHMQMFGRDLKRNREIFDYNFAYFNSGVLLIDRQAYGAADVPARTRDMSTKGLLQRLQYDQALLNLVFKDNWLPLDYRWNLICPEPAHEALEPFVLHYTGPKKPWGLLPGAAFGRLYRHTMTNAVFEQFRRERLMAVLRSPLKRLSRGA